MFFLLDLKSIKSSKMYYTVLVNICTYNCVNVMMWMYGMDN